MQHLDGHGDAAGAQPAAAVNSAEGARADERVELDVILKIDIASALPHTHSAQRRLSPNPQRCCSQARTAAGVVALADAALKLADDDLRRAIVVPQGGAAGTMVERNEDCTLEALAFWSVVHVLKPHKSRHDGPSRVDAHSVACAAPMFKPAAAATLVSLC